ncbi:hypothetical protein F511_37343 [Dorcoceras hygrometricum]|uniref:Uncharacterized protein n=1 Tax=Dorcoceras hygrometricum TaxID=472368 RepID=A0A2Z7AC54_9LAMI|nr:hypothetical protein F511_37343 [Dorcoceras hygrometricum]
MASSFSTTALQVNFDSVLGITDNAEMFNMFKALESTGLRGFLGCPSVLYEQELEQFFDTALVQDNDITGVVSGKNIAITEDRIKVNWSKILFGVLKEMVDKTLKRAKGFAAQICVLLKGDPAVTLGDATLVVFEEVSTGSSCTGARINEKATRVGQPFGVDFWMVALSAVALRGIIPAE